MPFEELYREARFERWQFLIAGFIMGFLTGFYWASGAVAAFWQWVNGF